MARGPAMAVCWPRLARVPAAYLRRFRSKISRWYSTTTSLHRSARSCGCGAHRMVQVDFSSILTPPGRRRLVASRAGGHPPSARLRIGWHHVQIEASQGSISVKVDGQPAGTASGSGARAGYLGWEVNRVPATFQVRNGEADSAGPYAPAFNGTDLGGWKPGRARSGSLKRRSRPHSDRRR